MTGHLLGHYWTVATMHFSNFIWMFATLRNVSIYLSGSKWNFNSIGACCYFGPHFGRWAKLLILAHKSICSRNFRGERPRDQELLKIKNSHELNASITKEAFINSFFDYSTNLFHFFSPQLFFRFLTSTTIIKIWVTPFPRQNKYRRCPSPPHQKNAVIVYALGTHFRAKWYFNFIYASRRNPTENWRAY